MSNFQLKQNDTKPSLYANLVQDGSAVDLADASVTFHMDGVVNAPAVVTDAANGSVRYDWTATDTAIAGSYRAEFQVTFSDGSIETFPNSGYFYVNIAEELA